ncbi:hypothetical protein FOZ63_030049, partial [Perkinsus olseni]
MAAQIFSFVAPQYPDRFSRTVGTTKVYMDVYESKSVVFMLEGHDLPMATALSTLDTDGAELQELFGNFTKFQISVQDKDLTTFSFNGVDAVSTTLQGETIVLMRAGLRAGNAPVALDIARYPVAI